MSMGSRLLRTALFGVLVLQGRSVGFAIDVFRTGVPVTVPHGEAVAPVAVAHSGSDWRPAELVVVSIPFARGTVQAGTPLTAYDSDDQPLPTESRVLSYWPDGTLRWVEARFESHRGTRKWDASFYGLGTKGITTSIPWHYRVRAGVAPPKPDVAVSVRRDGQRFIIDNGRLSVEVDTGSGAFAFSRVSMDGTDEPVSSPLHLHVVFENGTHLSTEGGEALEAQIEESGPLRAVVHLRGRLEDFYEWQTRLFIHADEPAIRAEHTIGGLGDDEIELVRRIYLEYDTALKESFSFRAAGESVELAGQVGTGESVVLRQTAPNLIPPRDFAYELSVEGPDKKEIAGSGGRSGGWLHAEDKRLTVGVAVRAFSEKGPKALGIASDGACTIDLWPEGDALRFCKARAITHQVLYAFYPPPDPTEFNLHWERYCHESDKDMPYRAYVRPLVPLVDTQFMCETQAFGPYVSAASSCLREFEEAMDLGFENWHARHMDRGVHYGMLHYGDYIAPWPGDDGGDPDRPHWRDEEWEMVRVLWTRFLRHGDRRAYHAAVAAYRHFMDVDVHYTRHFNFYHGYGNRGEMHEEYTRGNTDFHGREWGHIVCRGLIDAYVFTGDRRALEVARHLCDNLAAEFNKGDERLEALFGRQLREAAWPMLALIRCYEITREEKYIEAAGKAVDLMERKPEVWMRLGSVQSSMVSMALEDYHRATGDPIAARLFLDSVNLLLTSCYLPERRCLGRRPGCEEGPEVVAGVGLMIHAASLGYAYELTGDSYYLEVAYQLFHEGMKNSRGLSVDDHPARRHGYQSPVATSDGKSFAIANFYTNRLPTAFRELGLEDLEEMRVSHPPYRELFRREPTADTSE